MGSVQELLIKSSKSTEIPSILEKEWLLKAAIQSFIEQNNNNLNSKGDHLSFNLSK